MAPFEFDHERLDRLTAEAMAAEIGDKEITEPNRALLENLVRRRLFRSIYGTDAPEVTEDESYNPGTHEEDEAEVRITEPFPFPGKEKPPIEHIDGGGVERAIRQHDDLPGDTVYKLVN